MLRQLARTLAPTAALVLATGLLSPAEVRAAVSVSYVRDIGVKATAEVSPVDQVRDALGRWYLLDEALQCIQVYEGGRLVRSLFTCGTGGNDATHIRRARGLGLDRSAQVLWVADTTNHRVLKVALDGRVLATSTAAGAPGGRFSSPVDVTVDDRGAAYVVDGRNRVVKLSPAGTYLAQWGSTGAGVGQMSAPLAVDFSAVGQPTLYVTDAQNARVVRWSTAGAWRGSLGGPGTGPGRFSKQPRGLAVDRLGVLHVADVGGNRVNRFDAAGRVLAPLGSGLPYHRTGPTDLFYGARGLWVDGGTLAVADMWNYRTLLWTLQGAPVGVLGGPPPPPGGTIDPHGVARDAAGNVYVSDYWHQHIQKFAPDGRFLARWGVGRGSDPGTLNLPGGIDVDDRGRFLYIANREQRSVDRWRLSDGAFDARFVMPQGRAGAGWPRDVAVDEQAGLVYAPDDKGAQVVVFDARTGAAVRTVVGSGTSGTPLGVLTSVAVDEHGRLYVGDSRQQSVHVYERDGRWVTDLPVLGDVRGITVQDGVLYVLRDNVSAFSTADGRYLYRFGGSGSEDQRLHAPYVGIDVAADGTLLVADSDAGRVKLYRRR